MPRTYLSYAKFNLYLAVLGKRPDGYHEVDTVLQNVGLADRLEFEALPEPRLEVVTDADDVPDGAANLAYQALALLRETYPIDRGMRVRITKRIPARAGLGGGSSNAACALCAGSRLWGLDLGGAQLESLAARVGSDVPFFVRGGTQRCRGRGEQVAPLPGLPTSQWLIVKPPKGLTTAKVYAQVTPGLTSRSVKSRILLGALAKRELSTVVEEIFNDLEAAAEALDPESVEVKAWLGQLGLRGIVLAGSGAAWVGHCPDTAVGRIAEADGRRRGWQVFLVDTIERGWSEAKHGVR